VGHQVPDAPDVARLLVGVLALGRRRLAVEHVRHHAEHVGDRHRRVAIEPLLEVDVHAVRREIARRLEPLSEATELRRLARPREAREELASLVLEQDEALEDVDARAPGRPTHRRPLVEGDVQRVPSRERPVGVARADEVTQLFRADHGR
jgi:hypothetical protein